MPSSPGAHRRLRILTWHVHGNYLYYLTQVPHDFFVVTKPGSPPGYAGREGHLRWGTNLHEVPHMLVAQSEFDCVLYQSRQHWDRDQYQLLSPAQRLLPRIYLEHDPPRQHPTDTLHWVQDRNTLLVHVTPFNALMWDSGITPTRTIEHGVLIRSGVRHSGELEQGIAAINHLRRRGRRLGADLYTAVAERVPMQLIGMDSESLGGMGDIPNHQFADLVSHYRCFFHPARYTSLGLAVIEAMMVGLPIVGLATTELTTVIKNGVNGYIDTDPHQLIKVMEQLLHDKALACAWGAAARLTAHKRFNIDRFVNDWLSTFAHVTGKVMT